MTEKTFEYLKKEIEQVEYVSFDVFDTLLIRDFFHPIDIFNYIEYHYNIPQFQKRRIKAEHKARLEHHELNDITYQIIYDELFDIDSKVELNVETKACIQNSYIKQLYDYALSVNKQVIAISDMYLEKKIIQALLKENGYDRFKCIYVSSQINQTKSNGGLYWHVLRDLDIPPDQILHIGDNEHADFNKAVENGIRAFHYYSMRDRASKIYNSHLLRSLEKYNGPQASLYAGILAKNVLRCKKNGYWYTFGFEYGGGLLFNFADYIYKYCIEHGISRIYFMARDGKIMKEVFDFLFRNDKKIKTYYMFASRRMFFVPFLNKLDESTVEKVIESEQGTPYFDIINRFGYQWLINEAQEHFSDLKKPIGSKEDREELKRFFLLHKEEITREIKQEKERVLKYLQGIQFFEDSKKVLVDVGWGCSSQKYMESIVGEKIYGLYIGTHQYTYRHENIHGYIFNEGVKEKDTKLVMSALPVVELLFVGDHYSITNINNKLKPVYHRKSSEEDFRIAIAKRIHAGILDFIVEYQQVLKKYNLKVDHKISPLVIRSLIEKPNMQDIKEISIVPHAASLGESTFVPIIANIGQTRLSFWKNILYGNTRESSCLWPLGQEQYRRLTNKKEYKILVSFDLFIIKVKNCLSYSLIICLKKVFQKIFKRC